MIVYPNAKINLGLNIVEKRPDGYHNIETVFYPINLADALEIVFPTDSTEPYVWQSSGRTVDCPPEKNLCIKALLCLRNAAQERGISMPTVGLHLHKIVPMGAGLGGGSADAAFVIKYLNDLLRLGFSNAELSALSATIGADCPFFIENRPQFATGIGDVLSPISVDLAGKWLLLIKPPISVPTKTAYSKVHPHKPQKSVAEIVSMPIAEWRNWLVNDFEESVFAEYPEIAHLKEYIYAQDAIYAAMSGSGSSIFGIFEHEPNINKNFDTNFFVWKGRL